MSAEVHCVVAMFDSPHAVYEAAKKLTAEGYSKVDSHTPFPIHGMDGALRHGPSHLGWICVVCGAAGIGLAQLMMWWMNAVDYPLWVSGKAPYWWGATIPITFELMILLASFGAVFGMLGLNKLPRLHHPIFKHSMAHRMSDDAFFLSVDATDPRFDQSATVDLLGSIGGKHIEILED